MNVITTILLIALAITIIVHACVAYKRRIERNKEIVRKMIYNGQIAMNSLRLNRQHGVVTDEEYKRQSQAYMRNLTEIIVEVCGTKSIDIVYNETHKEKGEDCQ